MRNERAAFLVPSVTATLVDSFPDPDNDGKAAAGAEITYAATITNGGTTAATNVVYTNQIDSKTTLVAGSVQVQPDNQGVIRCTFGTAGGGSGGCNLTSSAYGVTDAANNTILGGQGDRINLAASGIGYNSGTQIFQLNATVQNLLEQSLGTIDNVTLEPAGIRLFLNRAIVTNGNGIITVANADGTAQFTAPNQPYFQYNQIIAQNQTSAAKNLRFNVPNTVSSFTLDFLVSTKVAATKLVINEVLANPANPILDADGEWFEVYNAGLFPVNMQGFKLGDTSAAGDRPTHTIASSLTIQPGGYLVFGNNANTAVNGGVILDYSYGSTLALANSQDAVRILSPYHVDPTTGNPGNVIELDRAQYFTPAVSALDGVSRELENPALENLDMDGSNWSGALVTAVYGPGGRGTPKAQNSTYTPFWGGNKLSPPEFDSQSKTLSANDKTATDNLPVINIAGETISVNVGTIAAGASLTIIYKVTVNNPIPTGAFQVSNQGTVSGGNFASVSTDDPAAGGATDSTVTPLAVPTAAGATVSGRAINSDGRAIVNAVVSLTDSEGQIRTTRTNQFGFYSFGDVPTGNTYVINARHKSYSFAPAVINVTDDVAEFNLTAVEP